MSTFKDRKGQRFGKLKVIKRGLNGTSSNGRSYVRWWCVCDCGFKFILVDASLHTSKLRYVHSKNGYYSLLKC